MSNEFDTLKFQSNEKLRHHDNILENKLSMFEKTIDE